MGDKDANNLSGQYLSFDAKNKIIKHQVYDETEKTWKNEATYTADEDTGWQTLTDGVTYRKKNGVVYVDITGNNFTLSTTNTVLGTLPAGYRPTSAKNFAVFTSDSNGALLIFFIRNTGEVNLRTVNGTATSAYGSVSFPV